MLRSEVPEVCRVFTTGRMQHPSDLRQLLCSTSLLQASRSLQDFKFGIHLLCADLLSISF